MICRGFFFQSKPDRVPYSISHRTPPRERIAVCREPGLKYCRWGPDGAHARSRSSSCAVAGAVLRHVLAVVTEVTWAGHGSHRATSLLPSLTSRSQTRQIYCRALQDRATAHPPNNTSSSKFRVACAVEHALASSNILSRARHGWGCDREAAAKTSVWFPSEE
jgi:hypothetical protein